MRDPNRMRFQNDLNTFQGCLGKVRVKNSRVSFGMFLTHVRMYLQSEPLTDPTGTSSCFKSLMAPLSFPRVALLTVVRVSSL